MKPIGRKILSYPPTQELRRASTANGLRMTGRAHLWVQKFSKEESTCLGASEFCERWGQDDVASRAKRPFTGFKMTGWEPRVA